MKSDNPKDINKVEGISYLEKCSFAIIEVLCLLPIIMSLYAFWFGFHVSKSVSGIEDSLASNGAINYVSFINAYYYLFLVIGFFSLMISVCAIFRIWMKDKTGLFKALGYWSLLFFAVLIWAGVATLVSDNPIHAFRGGDYVHDGYLSYIIYASIYVCASIINHSRLKQIVIESFCCSLCWLSVLVLLQDLGITMLDYCFPTKHAAVFNNPNHFGYLLSMGMMCFAGLVLFERELDDVDIFRSNIYKFGFGFLAYALLANGTFGAFISIVIVIPIGVFFRYCREDNQHGGRWFGSNVLLLLFILVCIGESLLPSSKLTENIVEIVGDIKHIISNSPEAEFAGSGRMILWKQTIEKIAERPILGYGPEGFYGANAIYAGRRPHNEYLQMAGYLGIPALGFYLMGLISLVRNRVKQIKMLSVCNVIVLLAVLAYLVSAFFGNTVFNTVLYLWMFLGMVSNENS